MLSCIEREASWPMRSIETFPSKQMCLSLSSYRIQNCFSTISTNILVNCCYFRDLWQILECKSLWITHIFAIYSDLSVFSIVIVISDMPCHQFWWFFVWFICRIAKFCANICDSFLNINFRLTVGLTFHLYFPHTYWRIPHHELSNINSEQKQFWTLPFA